MGLHWMDCFLFSVVQTKERVTMAVNMLIFVELLPHLRVKTQHLAWVFLNMDVLDILLKNMEVFQIIQLMLPVWLMNKNITSWAPCIQMFHPLRLYLVQMILLQFIVAISSFPPLQHCVVIICFFFYMLDIFL